MHAKKLAPTKAILSAKPKAERSQTSAVEAGRASMQANPVLMAKLAE